MGHAEHRVECAAPVDYSFGYVTDYQSLPQWVLGLKRISPLTDQTRGTGAVFEGEVNLGPITLPIRMDFTEWLDNSAFAVRFSGGVDGTLAVSFEASGKLRTRLTVALQYSVGSGISGRVLDKTIRAFLAPSFRYVDHHLPRQIENGYAELSRS